MILYIFGCASCGINGIYVKKLIRYTTQNNIELEIKNSKYDKQAREEHAIKLKEAGLDADTYQAIVVDGDKITRLREWIF